MPSMPVRFWNDPDGHPLPRQLLRHVPRRLAARRLVTITERGSVIIHGRSDSTLNRQGVRMGSADIYEVVETLPEIRESLVIGVEQPDGGYWMPLFVHLAEGAVLDDACASASAAAIRAATLAPPRPRRNHRGPRRPAHAAPASGWRSR